LLFYFGGYNILSTFPLQIKTMDALDLLADFAGLLSCSTSKPDPIDIKGNHKDIASSASKLSNTLHQDLQSAPEQSRCVIKIEDWTYRPHNSPSTSASQGGLLNQASPGYNYTWDRRGNLENCELKGAYGRHFDQYLTGQPGSIKGPHECFDSRYAPPWTNMYAFESNVFIFKDTRPLHQQARAFHDAEESIPCALPDYRPFESRCINAGCDCQAYGPRFTNGVHGYMPAPINVQRETEAMFRGSQMGRMYDPWMANEEQMRLSQAQHY
jgi:hypothetical protein